VKGGIERDSRVARGKHAEIGGDPQGMIRSEKRALGALRNVRLFQPVTDGFRHVAELGKGIALHGCSARSNSRGIMLKFNCDQVREAAGRLREAVVEHGRIVRGRVASRQSQSAASHRREQSARVLILTGRKSS
jgi:hypothetical protein